MKIKKTTKRNRELNHRFSGLSKNSYRRLLAKKVEEEPKKDKTWVSELVWNLRKHYLKIKKT
ncbi:MAG TPA: hypothetical protein DHV62_07235 [Elusimicrobia bacterium]|jgi:hypothetical protein|nr:hypothetical protein [Elusimicrobiota bacterium]